MKQRSELDRSGPYLGLDTSGAVGYVALARGGEVLAEERLVARGRHASELLPAAHRLLRQQGIGPRALAGVAVGAGPGSFTGVRVAAATAKGLSLALDVPLLAVSSLAAAALGPPSDERAAVRFVLFDARAARVYAACYGVARHRMEVLVPPHASDLRSVLGSDVPAGAVFCGDAAVRHREAIEGAGFTVADPPVGDPTASAVLRLALGDPDAHLVRSPDLWEPRYLKPSGAERGGRS